MLSVSADNTYLDLDYSGHYEKPNLINGFIIHCLEESNNKHIGEQLDITLGKNALRANPTGLVRCLLTGD